MGKILGFIVNGKYHRQEPNLQELSEDTQSTYKTWSHDIQREDHQVDIIQPYDRSGKPNEDFVMNYPTESKEVYKFVEEE